MEPQAGCQMVPTVLAEEVGSKPNFVITFFQINFKHLV